MMYDLDELDLNWLQSVNTKRKFRGSVCHFDKDGWVLCSHCVPSCIALASPKGLDEDILREALLTLETKVS